MAHRHLLVALLALLSPWGPVAGPTLAWGQEDDAIQQARADFQRAVELEQARDFAGALRLFRQVGQVKMTPQVRYHIATCEENLGKMVAALGGYRLALEDSAGMHPGFVEEVQQSIDYLEQRIPKLVLLRGAGADAALVELDGVAVGGTLLGTEIPLDPGPHAVVARAPGYLDYTATVVVKEGTREELSIELVAIPPPPEPVAPPPVVEEQNRRKYGATPYVLGGVGAAAAITGGVLFGVSLGKVNQLEALCGSDLYCDGLGAEDYARSEQLFSSAKAFNAGGWVMVGLGVAALTTGTVLWLTDPGKKSSETSTARLRLDFSAPRADVGLSLHRSF